MGKSWLERSASLRQFPKICSLFVLFKRVRSAFAISKIKAIVCKILVLYISILLFVFLQSSQALASNEKDQKERHDLPLIVPEDTTHWVVLFDDSGGMRNYKYLNVEETIKSALNNASSVSSRIPKYEHASDYVTLLFYSLSCCDPDYDQLLHGDVSLRMMQGDLDEIAQIINRYKPSKFSGHWSPTATAPWAVLPYLGSLLSNTSLEFGHIVIVRITDAQSNSKSTSSNDFAVFRTSVGQYDFYRSNCNKRPQIRGEEEQRRKVEIASNTFRLDDQIDCLLDTRKLRYEQAPGEAPSLRCSIDDLVKANLNQDILISYTVVGLKTDVRFLLQPMSLNVDTERAVLPSGTFGDKAKISLYSSCLSGDGIMGIPRVLPTGTRWIVDQLDHNGEVINSWKPEDKEISFITQPFEECKSNNRQIFLLGNLVSPPKDPSPLSTMNEDILRSYHVKWEEKVIISFPKIDLKLSDGRTVMIQAYPHSLKWTLRPPNTILVPQERTIEKVLDKPGRFFGWNGKLSDEDILGAYRKSGTLGKYFTANDAILYYLEMKYWLWCCLVALLLILIVSWLWPRVKADIIIKSAIGKIVIDFDRRNRWNEKDMKTSIGQLIIEDSFKSPLPFFGFLVRLSKFSCHFQTEVHSLDSCVDDRGNTIPITFDMIKWKLPDKKKEARNFISLDSTNSSGYDSNSWIGKPYNIMCEPELIDDITYVPAVDTNYIDITIKIKISTRLSPRMKISPIFKGKRSSETMLPVVLRVVPDEGRVVMKSHPINQEVLEQENIFLSAQISDKEELKRLITCFCSSDQRVKIYHRNEYDIPLFLCLWSIQSRYSFHRAIKVEPKIDSRKIEKNGSETPVSSFYFSPLIAGSKNNLSRQEGTAFTIISKNCLSVFMAATKTKDISVEVIPNPDALGNEYKSNIAYIGQDSEFSIGIFKDERRSTADVLLVLHDKEDNPRKIALESEPALNTREELNVPLSISLDYSGEASLPIANIQVRNAAKQGTGCVKLNISSKLKFLASFSDIICEVKQGQITLEDGTGYDDNGSISYREIPICFSIESITNKLKSIADKTVPLPHHLPFICSVVVDCSIKTSKESNERNSKYRIDVASCFNITYSSFWFCIDFGTQAVAAAVARSLEDVRLLDLQSVFSKELDGLGEERGTKYVPSAIVLAQGDDIMPVAGEPDFVHCPASYKLVSSFPGSSVFGLKSIFGGGREMIQLDDNIKYKIASKTGVIDTEINSKTVPLNETIQSTFSALIGTTCNNIDELKGSCLSRLIATCPNTFSVNDKIEFENVIRNAFPQINPAYLRLVSESDAAALYCLSQYIHKDTNELILVYDMGAGTLDLTLMEARWEKLNRDATMPSEVIIHGRCGAKTAGNKFDEILGRVIHEELEKLAYEKIIQYHEPIVGNGDPLNRSSTIQFGRQVREFKKTLDLENAKFENIFEITTDIYSIIDLNKLKSKGLLSDNGKLFLKWLTSDLLSRELINKYFEFVTNILINIFIDSIDFEPKRDITTIFITGRAARLSGLVQKIEDNMGIKPVFFENELKDAVPLGALISALGKIGDRVKESLPTSRYFLEILDLSRKKRFIPITFPETPGTSVELTINEIKSAQNIRLVQSICKDPAEALKKVPEFGRYLFIEITGEHVASDLPKTNKVRFTKTIDNRLDVNLGTYSFSSLKGAASNRPWPFGKKLDPYRF